ASRCDRRPGRGNHLRRCSMCAEAGGSRCILSCKDTGSGRNVQRTMTETGDWLGDRDRGPGSGDKGGVGIGRVEQLRRVGRSEDCGLPYNHSMRTAAAAADSCNKIDDVWRRLKAEYG